MLPAQRPDKQSDIGLIIPPPEIRKIADKTAQFIAQRGSHYESMVWEKQSSDPKFCFLRHQNPYRAYFDYRLGQLQRGLIQKIQDQEPVNPTSLQALALDLANKHKKEPLLFWSERPKLSATQLQVMKATASFVAKNGKNFGIALQERQKNNGTFQFLRPNSQKHAFYMSLLEGYARILTGIDSVQQLLEAVITDRHYLLNRAKSRHQAEKAEKPTARVSAKRQELRLDWQEFQIIERVYFSDQETKPKKHLLQQKQKQSQKSSSLRMSQRCPNCSQVYLVVQMEAHLRICLTDPAYLAKKSEQSKQRVSNVDISAMLKRSAKDRQDIFGQQQDQQEQKPKKRPIQSVYDGQNGGLSRTSANAAMIREQLKQAAKNLKKQR